MDFQKIHFKIEYFQNLSTEPSTRYIFEFSSSTLYMFLWNIRQRLNFSKLKSVPSKISERISFANFDSQICMYLANYCIVGRINTSGEAERERVNKSTTRSTKTLRKNNKIYQRNCANRWEKNRRAPNKKLTRIQIYRELGERKNGHTYANK